MIVEALTTGGQSYYTDDCDSVEEAWATIDRGQPLLCLSLWTTLEVL